MRLIREEERCYCIKEIFSLASSLSAFVTIVCCWCCAFAALCCVQSCFRCITLTTLWSLGLCAISFCVFELYYTNLFPSYAAVLTEV